MPRTWMAAVTAAAVLAASSLATAVQAEAATGPAPDETNWAKWAAILAGLSLAVSVWLYWNMRTLARNQVELGRMIMTLRGR